VNKEEALIKDFLKKYKYYILIPFILFILITAALIIFSGGPQKGAFIYQIF